MEKLTTIMNPKQRNVSIFVIADVQTRYQTKKKKDIIIVKLTFIFGDNSS